MDTEYILPQPINNINTITVDDDNEKNQSHTVAYYRFLDETKNNIDKIENEYCGEEIQNLENHFDLIKEYEQEFETQRENCLYNYSILKDEVTNIQNSIPDFNIEVFNGFFQNFEEFYLFFTKAQEIIKIFMDFNDETQNVYYILKRKNFCIDALKDMNLKMSEEFGNKIEKYEKIEEDYKELQSKYDYLKKIYEEESKKENQTDILVNLNENKNNEIIDQLNSKINHLNNEKDRFQRMNSENLEKMENLKTFMKSNCVLRRNSVTTINELQFKINKYEIENLNQQNIIKDLQEENQKLNKEKEYLEEQINNHLTNLSKNSKEDSKIYSINQNENENENENENKVNKNDYYTNDCVNNLGLLLGEGDSEEQSITSSKNSKNKILIGSKINLEIIKDNKKDKSLSGNLNEFCNLKSLRKAIKNVVKECVGNRSRLSSTSTHKRKQKKFIQSKINKAYNLMFPKKENLKKNIRKQKINTDYFMQFFYLLFQSMKMNSNNIALFLNYDPEELFFECKKEHIPYYKFEEWLQERIYSNDLEMGNKESLDTVTGIICSSII